MQKWITFLSFSFFLCLQISLEAQLNVNIGYDYNYRNPKEINQFIGVYNDGLAPDVDKLPIYHGMSGLMMGLRYRFSNIGFEFDYETRFKTLKSQRRNTYGDIVSDKQLSFKDNNYSLGIETFIGNIGFGTTLDYNEFISRSLNFTETSQHPILNEKGWSSHFYLNFEFTTWDWSSISFRPYVQIPWTAVDLSDLATELNAYQAGTDYKVKNYTYGIRIVLCNGRHND